jgi:hypothetical protein
MMRLLASSLVVLTVLVLGGTAAAADGIAVAVDRTAISTSLGHRFLLRTTISNHGSAQARDLVAHLNVLSLDGSVYVDPEDWSSHRTRYLAPIPAGGSITLTWRLQAVNSGRIGIYVAVLPRSGAPRPPTTGATVRVSIAKRRTLNSGGILPLAVGIPLLLGGLTVGLRLKRRAGTP